MTLVLETGAGVLLANSYVTTAYIDSYLSARGRSTENNWNAKIASQKAEFAIAATDYIERAFRQWFKGTREFEFTMVAATGSIVFAGLPTDTEQLTVGDQVYTFVAALTGVADEVLIGADADGSASNLKDALCADADNEGTTYGTGTLASRHVTVVLATATLTLTATADGVSGNDTVLSGTVTNVTLTALTGGKDGGSQPLSFPRSGLIDASGNRVLGIPRELKEATAEYGVRAASADLMPDPTSDPRGGLVARVREKVGPIEEETEYVPGTALSGSLTPYPAADRLLSGFLRPRGVVSR